MIRGMHALARTDPSDPASTLLQVKAIPGARRDGIAGTLGDRLKVRVSAPPEGGKANDAIRALVAGRLGLKPHDVTLVLGAASADKTLRIAGLSPAEVIRRLGA